MTDNQEHVLPATRVLSLILVHDSLKELRSFFTHLVVECDERSDILTETEIDDLDEVSVILNELVKSLSKRIKTEQQ